MLKSLASLDEITPPLYPPIGVLDYPGANLAMEAMTDFNRDTGKQLAPERAYRLNACRKEPWTVAWVETIPLGGVLFDVGANVGSYTLVAASRGVPVVAIEPARPNIGALMRNVWRNNLAASVIGQQVALGDRTGLVWINYGDMRSGSANHEIGDNRNPTLQREIIPIWRLDDLLNVMPIPRPTHLKVDVDGAEVAVLLGAEETLAGPDLQSIMLEMRLDLEAEITTWLGERNWQLAERFNMRDGQEIAGICYGLFERAILTETTVTSTASLSEGLTAWYPNNGTAEQSIEASRNPGIDAGTRDPA